MISLITQMNAWKKYGNLTDDQFYTIYWNTIFARKNTNSTIKSKRKIFKKTIGFVEIKYNINIPNYSFSSITLTLSCFFNYFKVLNMSNKHRSSEI